MFENTIALANGVTVPQLCIRYDIQLGMIVLPKTANPDHMRSRVLQKCHKIILDESNFR